MPLRITSDSSAPILQHRDSHRLRKRQGGSPGPHSLVIDKQSVAQGGDSQSGHQAPSSEPQGSNARPPLALSHGAVEQYLGPRARRPEGEAAVPL